MRCGAGVLSYCKVRALTRIATKENEAFLVQLGETGTVSHVEKTVRLYRRTNRPEELAAANEQHAERGLRCYFDESGALVLEGRLDPVQGALIMKALQAAGAALREAEHASREALADPPDRAKEAYPARMADAMGLLCESFLAHGAQPLAAGDRHLVTVHIDERVLRDEGRGGQEPHRGRPTPAARHGAAPLLRRQPRRDRGARGRHVPSTSAAKRGRFPRRCGVRSRLATRAAASRAARTGGSWTPITSITGSNGGETQLGNLVTLCRRHHRFVHEYGFQRGACRARSCGSRGRMGGRSRTCRRARASTRGKACRR